MYMYKLCAFTYATYYGQLRQNYDIVKGDGEVRGGGGGGGGLFWNKSHTLAYVIHSETDFFKFFTEVTFNGDLHVRIFGWLKVPSMKSI